MINSDDPRNQIIDINFNYYITYDIKVITFGEIIEVDIEQISK